MLSLKRIMKVMMTNLLNSETMNQNLSEHATNKVIIKSDGWKGFNHIKDVSAKHIKKIVPPKEASKVLPWVHTMIRNARRTFLGINHHFKKEYLQYYLNEFCYKTNRRYFNDHLFDRLVIASIETTWYGK